MHKRTTGKTYIQTALRAVVGDDEYPQRFYRRSDERVDVVVPDLSQPATQETTL